MLPASPHRGADLRAVHRALQAGDRVHTLWWQTNADRFDASLSEFEALAKGFVPAPA